MMLSDSDLLAVNSVAASLGVPGEWLLNLIAFETAGTFNPMISNPYSSAKGLIQFIDSTAKGLGYKNSQDLVEKNPTFQSQLLGPVKNYFLKMKPFPTKQSLYMSVFYPAYRSVNPLTVFSDSIRAVNPGIDTVQSYIDKVDKKKILSLLQRLAAVG